jgi:hypothetical protein
MQLSGGSGLHMVALLERPCVVLPRLGALGFLTQKAGWTIIDHSRYSVPSLATGTVQGEFKLFVASHNSSDLDSQNRTKRMLQRWELYDSRDLSFNELSGGMKKFFLLALQCEGVITDKVLVANAQHQLDPHRLTLIATNLVKRDIHKIVWCEDSVHMLELKLGRPVERVVFESWLNEDLAVLNA